MGKNAEGHMHSFICDTSCFCPSASEQLHKKQKECGFLHTHSVCFLLNFVGLENVVSIFTFASRAFDFAHLSEFQVEAVLSLGDFVE